MLLILKLCKLTISIFIQALLCKIHSRIFSLSRLLDTDAQRGFSPKAIITAYMDCVYGTYVLIYYLFKRNMIKFLYCIFKVRIQCINILECKVVVYSDEIWRFLCFSNDLIYIAYNAPYQLS